MLDPTHTLVTDTFQRPLQTLRISVTDRCNFRCSYCMPKSIFNNQYNFLPKAAFLNFNEIIELAKIFIAFGVTKIRITGGEPLLRKDLEKLIAQLAALRTANHQSIELALTTNGALLTQKAQTLKQSGLDRLTISLDALDNTIFRKMNDMDIPVHTVLEGIQAAKKAGFTQIKINTVIQRGINDQQILPLVRYFKGTGHILRFIEYMDVGTANAWKQQDVLSSKEIIQQIQQHYPIEQLTPNSSGEVAKRWRYQDGSGEIGFISSVTQAFCKECNRARLTTDGKLFTCLFATQGIDLAAPLRAGENLDKLRQLIESAWRKRDDHYSELRTQNNHPLKKVEMFYLGG